MNIHEPSQQPHLGSSRDPSELGSLPEAAVGLAMLGLGYHGLPSAGWITIIEVSRNEFKEFKEF